MFLLSFFVLRFLVLWTGVELTSHYDELDLGTMAKELLEGLKMPYPIYQLDAYSGESLILGAAVVPFFKWMGMNLMAVKMVPLLFSFCTLVLSFLFLRRHFGEKTARTGAWLLVLSPAVFVQLSLVGMSGHTEALLWSVAAVFAFYEFLHSRQSRIHSAALFLFGLLSGFGFWFYYANGIMTLVCLLAWLVLEPKKFFSRHLIVFLFGFLIGFSPWLALKLQDFQDGFIFFSQGIGRSDFGHPVLHGIRKTIKLVIAGIPSSFILQPALGIPERFLSYLYWLFCFVPAVLWGGKTLFSNHLLRAKVLPLALYPIVFCCVFGAVFFDLRPDFDFIGYRYLTPLLFWSLLLFAVMAARIKMGKILTAAVLLLGLIGQSALMFREPGGRALHYQGYSYYQLGIRLGLRTQKVPEKSILNFDDIEKIAQQWRPQERYYFYWGISMAGMLLGENRVYHRQIAMEDFLKRNLDQKFPYVGEWAGVLDEAASVNGILKAGEALAQPRRDYYLKGWLDWWWQIHSLLNCPDCADLLHPANRSWAYRNLGKYSYYHLLDNLYTFYWKDPFYLFRNDVKESDLENLSQSLTPFDPQERQWIYQGVGRARLAEAFYSNILWTRPFEKLLQVSENNRVDIFWGMGWGIREMFREDAVRARDWIKSLPADGQVHAMEGFAEFERWYRVPA